jgi:hypothetical protein
VSIADLKGWGYSNSDIRGYLAALSILQVWCPTMQYSHIAIFNLLCLRTKESCWSYFTRSYASLKKKAFMWT